MGIGSLRLSSRVVVLLALFIAVGMPGHSESGSAAEVDERVGLVRDIYPGWSPDGRHITFHSTRMGPVAQIFRMELATGEVTQLTSGPGEKRVARWSPDGRRIAFHREEDETLPGDLFVMNADGSGLENLTRDAAGYWHPSWVSNDQILFDSDRDDSGEAEVGIKELYILSLSSSLDIHRAGPLLNSTSESASFAISNIGGHRMRDTSRLIQRARAQKPRSSECSSKQGKSPS